MGGISCALMRLKSRLSPGLETLIDLKIASLDSTEKFPAGFAPEWQGAQRVSRTGWIEVAKSTWARRGSDRVSAASRRNICFYYTPEGKRMSAATPHRGS